MAVDTPPRTGAHASCDAGPGRRNRPSLADRLRRDNPLAALAALLWLAIVIVPIYVMINASFQSQSSALGGDLLVPTTHPTLQNYKLAFQNGFMHLLFNTVVVTVATIVLVLGLSVPLAFAIVRARGRHSSLLVFRIFLLGLAIPAPVILVPLYVMVSKMGLYDTLWAIILPTVAFAMPVTLLVLVGTMRDISEELYEAMALEGATPARMLFKLVIPLSRGGISTVAVFSGLSAWNGLLFPLILTQSPQNEVLTTGLWSLSSEYGVDIPAMLAALTLAGIPMLVLYLAARRALISSVVGFGGR